MYNRSINDEKYPPRDLQWFIAAAKEGGIAERRRAGDAFTRGQVALLLYEAMCQREGVVDFAELPALLRGGDAARRHPRIGGVLICWSTSSGYERSSIGGSSAGGAQCSHVRRRRRR
jgi:hypothetical protein